MSYPPLRDLAVYKTNREPWTNNEISKCSSILEGRDIHTEIPNFSNGLERLSRKYIYIFQSSKRSVSHAWIEQEVEELEKISFEELVLKYSKIVS